MIKTILLLLGSSLLIPSVLTGQAPGKNNTPGKITVAAYYFPNYHTGDVRNIKNKGNGWSEWKLVKAAQPRFPGHDQPKVPLWGYTDEKDPKSEWGNFGYPFTNIIGNNTPENFKTALQMTKDKLLADPQGPHILNINCWNEWTEGSYLEPDIKNKFGYLEAVKSVFKSGY